MSSPTITIDELISIESSATQESILEQGEEVLIDDLLEDALSQSSPSERDEYERKLQSLYSNTPFYQQLQNKIRSAAILGQLIAEGKAVVCDRCGSVYEIGEWPLCGSGFGRDHGRVTSRNAQTDTVTAYYVNRSTGKIWIPGQNQHRKPIDRTGRDIAGYERHEVRNFRDRDKFYKMMDSVAKKKYYANLRREQQTFDPLFAEGRKQARQQVMSAESRSPEQSYGREWLEKQIKKTEAAAAAKLNYNPNTMIEAWEFSSANLDEANLDKLHSTTLEKQPVLSERHKKAIGKAASRQQQQKQGQKVA